MLLSTRGGFHVNDNGVTCDNLTPAARNSKVVVVLNLVLVVRFEERYLGFYCDESTGASLTAIMTT